MVTLRINMKEPESCGDGRFSSGGYCAASGTAVSGETKRPADCPIVTEEVPEDVTVEMIREYVAESYAAQMEDGCLKIEVFADRGDKMSAEDAAAILESEDPENAFLEKMADWYGYGDCYIEEIALEAVKHFEIEGFRCSLNDAFEVIRDMSEITFPETHYLKQEFNVPIMLDTGDAGSDFTLNDLMYEAENGLDLPDEASLVWLTKQQGHSKKKLREALLSRYDPEDVTFLSSVEQELANAPGYMQVLTFLVRMSFGDLLEVNKRMRLAMEGENTKFDINARRDCGKLVLSSTTMCGLFAPWTGAGSLLEIELEKDVEIPIKYIWSCLPDMKQGPHGYGVDETYGLTGSAWTYGEVRKLRNCVNNIRT